MNENRNQSRRHNNLKHCLKLGMPVQPLFSVFCLECERNWPISPL